MNTFFFLTEHILATPAPGPGKAFHWYYFPQPHMGARATIHFMEASHTPGTTLPHLMLTTTLRGRGHFYPCFAQEKTVAGKSQVAC